MGIVVSTTATSPFFLTSGIVGFVSFAFTVSTFLKVVWENITTLTTARHEVHGYLTNLRQELLEERASLRLLKKSIKRRRRAHDDRHGRRTGDSIDLDLDEATLKTMGDAVRSFIKTFQEIERPFLEHGEDGIQQSSRRRSRRRGQSPSQYYAHSAYQSPETDYEKRAHGSDDEPDDDKFWPQRVRYCNFTLRCRFAWLSRKSQAQVLFDKLSRLQTRRIARQVSGVGVAVYEYGEKMSDLEDALDRIEDRLHRIVGVRRIPE